MSKRVDESQKTISRRNVTKAMAWAVPATAVAVAVPTPAFAASGRTPIITEYKDACKAPGNSCNSIVKGYAAFYTITNPSQKTIWITNVQITRNTSGLNLGLATVPALPFEVPAGGSADITFNATANNSANLSFELDFDVTWGHAADGSDHDHLPVKVTSIIASTPPRCCK